MIKTVFGAAAIAIILEIWGGPFFGYGMFTCSIGLALLIDLIVNRRMDT